jgi:pimeloyl-ACP methyl ester carboxylesterase
VAAAVARLPAVEEIREGVSFISDESKGEMMRYRPDSQVPGFRSIRRCAAGLLCALAIAVLVPSSAWAKQEEKKEERMRCRELSFEVTLSQGDTTPYDVFGVLCARGSLRNKTIQIALHGATYDHSYWDWQYRPRIYSYARQATSAGYAVLSLDRIGAGQSDRPPAEEVTIESNAYVVHQIVQALRGGGIVSPSFGRIRAERVVLVGHSLGSVISIQEAATYGDVDGVVLTGVSHTVTPALGDVSFYPANLDPRFSGQNLPDGYFTTVPGTRPVFYHLPSTDPVVVAVDEQTKETVTVGELNTAVSGLAFSTGVHVPVLVVVGNFDAAFCNAPSCSASGSLDAEPDFYPADACAEAVFIAGAGHDLNLHLQAPVTFSTVLSWMNRRVGASTQASPPDPCP